MLFYSGTLCYFTVGFCVILLAANRMCSVSYWCGLMRLNESVNEDFCFTYVYIAMFCCQQKAISQLLDWLGVVCIRELALVF